MLSKYLGHPDPPTIPWGRGWGEGFGGARRKKEADISTKDRQFQLDGAVPDDVRTLAYIGDAVCSLYIRQWLTGPGGHVRNLTQKAAGYSCAVGQAKAMEAILPGLSEEEADILRRGRNAKCGVVPRGCDPVDYRKATGFEALMGWLYVQGRKDRLEELLKTAYTPPVTF